jgi:tagatose 1,6-diphosphate aldolase
MSMSSQTRARPAKAVLDPGKARGLQRVTSPDGFFLICALDHLSDFQQLLAKDPSTVDYRQTVEAKLDLIRTLSPQLSAFLLDARYGLAQAILARALPGNIGMMASVEDEDYDHGPGERRTRFRTDWGTRRIKMIGADVCKLLWFYRPEADTAAHQRDVVKKLVEECALLSLPLVVEPIWYPLADEDPKSAAWRAGRVEGIIQSAVECERLGVDLLKVEFPGYVDSEEGRAAAALACERLDAGLTVPWVILSAGVGYEDFRTQVQIACAAGASGFMAGRSIWRDAVSAHEPAARKAGAADAARRLAELAAVTRAHGRPFAPALEGAALMEAVPEHWSRTWQA